MISAFAAKVMAGALAVALAIGGILAWQLTVQIEKKAEARAALSTALAANASLIDERKRAVAEAERNRQISATALRQVQQIDDKMGRLKERILRGDACLIDPADAAAMDGLFQ